MNRKLICSALVMLALVLSSTATTNMYVHAPHGTRRLYKANVEEVSVSIKPKGLYSEIGLYLTIGEDGNDYHYNDANDSLEIVMDFELPEEAVVTDLWLWVYGDIVRGKIMDKWTASSIYNGIVKEKKDPSIIYKQSSTQYQLRIYPLAHGENRKIKLTYLLPNTIVGNDMMVNIPGMEMLRKSFSLPETMKLILKPSPEGIYPHIAGGSFTPASIVNDDYGQYQAEYVPLADSRCFPEIVIPGVLSRGYYVTKYSDPSGENFFQVSSIARTIEEKPRKHLVVVDCNPNETVISKSAIASVVARTMKKYASQDSVKVVFSDESLELLSTAWMIADSDFEIDSNKISHSQSLLPLLEAVSTWGDADDVIFLTTNNSYSEEASSNRMKSALVSAWGTEKPIHILDLWNLYLEDGGYDYNRRKRVRIGNRWFDNNEYLYQNISLNTGGVYRTDWNNRSYYYNTGSEYDGEEYLTSFFEEVLTNTGGKIIEDYTLKTELSSGWTYSEYDSERNGYANYGVSPISTIGKYKGDGDFTIETIYSLNDSIVRDIDEIPALEVLETDSTLLQYWYGYYINELEQSSPNRNEIHDIISVSTENRVLSQYTSFLCLEPADTVPICEDCFDESGLETPITKIAFSKTPFSFSVNGMNLNLQVTLPDSFTGNSLKLNIFNLRGQLVHTITVSDISSGLNTVSLSLESSNIATGQYIAQISGDGYNKNVRFAIQ